MAIILEVNGTDFVFPEEGDIQWGKSVTDWAQAITTGMLQKAGGLFTLLDEVDFGATYGLMSAYYKTRTLNIAEAGGFRLARVDEIHWRAEDNLSDNVLSVNNLNQLQWNGQNLVVGSVSIDTVADTSTIHLEVTGTTLTANVIAASIDNSHIAAAAGIALSKLAAVTASRALVSSAGGFISASAVTATELGYVSGVTSAIQTQLNAKVNNSAYTAKGDMLVASAASTPAVLGVGANGTVHMADSTQTTGTRWKQLTTQDCEVPVDLVIKTSNYTVQPTDQYVFASAFLTPNIITLPNPNTMPRKKVVIGRSGTDFQNHVIIETHLGVEITRLHTDGEQVTLFNDGTTWGQLGPRLIPPASADLGAMSISAVTTAPGKGTTTRDKRFFRRSGRWAVFNFQFANSVAGTAGTGEYLWGLPSGVAIDTSVVPASTAAAGIGNMFFLPTSSGRFFSSSGPTSNAIGPCMPYNTSQFRVLDTIAAGLFKGSAQRPLSETQSWSFEVWVPVSGWNE